MTIEESKVVQEKYKSMYEACRRELAERHAQLEEIRTKVSFCSQCACWFNTLHVVINMDLNLLKAHTKNYPWESCKCSIFTQNAILCKLKSNDSFNFLWDE